MRNGGKALTRSLVSILPVLKSPWVGPLISLHLRAPVLVNKELFWMALESPSLPTGFDSKMLL